MSRSRPPRQQDLHDIARRAMMQRGLWPDFSPGALAETKRIANTPLRVEADMRDLRGLSWCSIDNDDSKDLDQLSVAQRGNGDRTKILIAIADVASRVDKGSEIDQHARTNTTSVYTAAGIFPMLPTPLSTDITSLNPGVERAAVVIELSVDAEGDVEESDVYRALVVNHAQLAYNSVAAWLDGKERAPAALTAIQGLDENLRLQDRIAQRMKTRRHAGGALSLESTEARPVFDGDTLLDLQRDEKNRAKELIEDFMIAANGVTARFLEKKRFPSLRRVLDTPERWDRIVEVCAGEGGRLPAIPSGPALEECLTKLKQSQPDRFPDISLSIVKLLGRGKYVLELPGQDSAGHFGLAVRDYTHSTAPNRRFPDLITQRLLQAAISGEPVPYRRDELDALAQHCTQQEDNATKVERQVSKSAAAMLLEGRVGEQFDAIVTGASDKGTWVRIFHPAVEGKVVRGFEDIDVGDHVRVKLLGTDVDRGYIDFALVR
ncbi:MAG: RNB domain-containing ribonuclease [Planctomycetes bacterium]|nr:RNB domain-containing ribonuclease [Planctomycetota bacterium]